LASKNREVITYFDECAVQNELLAASPTPHIVCEFQNPAHFAATKTRGATELRPHSESFLHLKFDEDGEN